MPATQAPARSGQQRRGRGICQRDGRTRGARLPQLTTQSGWFGGRGKALWASKPNWSWASDAQYRHSAQFATTRLDTPPRARSLQSPPDHLVVSVTSHLTRRDLAGLALRGGLPEAVARPAGRRRQQWFADYLETTVQQDVRQLANIEGLVEIPRLLSILAERATGLLNVSDVGRDLAMNRFTVKRYLDPLQVAFLIDLLPA